jgi:hypothetical protein
MKTRKYVMLVVLCIVGCLDVHAFDPAPGDDDVFVRVVDCGQALCCVVKMPGDKYMIYDAGNYTDGGALTFEKVQDIIPRTATCN